MASSKILEVFQDLDFVCPKHERKNFRELLLAKVAAPWIHNTEKEVELASSTGTNDDVMVFERLESDDLPAVGLVLWSSKTGYSVTNIVPKKVGEINISVYNNILQDFYDKVAGPAIKHTHYSVHISDAQQSLSTWLPEEAAEALERFSALANKSTGSAHPRDRDRWFEFLITAYKNSGTFNTDLLIRWLTEVERWPEERAHDLAIEYEFGLGLLEQYDRTR